MWVNYADLTLPSPDSYADEKEFTVAALDDLSSCFHIQREVRGRFVTGEPLRLDAVLRPRDPSSWFDDQPVFGVEFKAPTYGSLKEEASNIRQAVDYSYCEFGEYGRLSVFLCPSPVLNHLREARRAHAEYEQRAAEESSIEHQRRRVMMASRAVGQALTDAEIEADARTQVWKARKRLRVIEDGARAEGFRGVGHRRQEEILRQVGFMTRILGGLGVGELMQHRQLGWILLRSGERIWSQFGDPVRRPFSLRPRLGSK
jgi:hypothetical protein